MASEKDTFEPNTFEANTFGCGTWRGIGITLAGDPDHSITLAASYRHVTVPNASRHVTVEDR